MKALVVATGIVFWTLVLGIAWLAFFPGSDAGEPVAILQVEPGAGSTLGRPRMLAPRPTPSARASVERGPTSLLRQRHLQPTPTRRHMRHASRLRRNRAWGQTASADASSRLAQATSCLSADRPPTAPPSPADAAPPDGSQGTAEGGEQSASTAPAPSAPPRRARSSKLAAVASAAPDHSGRSNRARSASAGARRRAGRGIAVRPAAESGLRWTPSDRCLCEAVTLRGQGYSGRTRARSPSWSRGLGLPDSPPGDVLKGLPAPISVAYGAYGRNLQDWVTRARADGHEVLLQIPLEPTNYPNGGSRSAYAADVAARRGEHEAAAMADVALYRLCRASPTTWAPSSRRPQDALTPVLEEVKRRGLLYVDDGSVQGSTVPRSPARSASIIRSPASRSTATRRRPISPSNWRSSRRRPRSGVPRSAW